MDVGCDDEDSGIGEAHKINCINAFRGKHSRLQQKAGVESMYLYYFVENNFKQLAAKLAKANVHHLGNVSEKTIIRWFDFHYFYGELPLDYAKLWKTRQWKRKEKNINTNDVITDNMWQGLKGRLDEEPILYLDEMKEYFQDEWSTNVHISTISRKLKSEGFTSKLVYSKA